MKRSKEELQHIFDAKIDRLQDFVNETESYDVESEKRMMIAIDIAVNLRAFFGSSNGGTLISKTGYDKEIIFPFYNSTEPLNLLHIYFAPKLRCVSFEKGRFSVSAISQNSSVLVDQFSNLEK